jgi:hypothetical protein
MTEESKEVAASANTAVSAFEDFGFTADAGFEEMDSSDRIIPFLRVLQSGAAQLKQQKPEYIPEAREGNLLLTSEKKLYDGNEGVYVVPVYYNKRYNEWGANRGGLKGIHDDASILQKTIQKHRADGKFEGNFLPNGNQVVEHRNLYVMVVDPVNKMMTPAIISAASTQAKPMKELTNLLFSFKRQGIPLQYYLVKVRSFPTSNDSGDWSLMVFQRLGSLYSKEEGKKLLQEMKLEWLLEPQNMKDLKEFYEMCKSGSIKTDEKDQQSDNFVDGEEIPF